MQRSDQSRVARDAGIGAHGNIGFIASIVAVASIGGFMFGYDSGVVNGTQEGLESTFSLSRLGTGFSVGAILLGCAAGAFAAGRLADRFGRKPIMLVAAILFLVSALGAGAATNISVFVLARIVGGLGVGAASVLSPIYISEVAPAALRGRLATLQQIMIITGLTGAFVVNYALAHLAGSSTTMFWLGYPAWRWMFWMQAIPAIVYLVALLAIPESPRYLMTQRRTAQARSVLVRLFGPGEAARKVEEIEASLAGTAHRSRLTDLLTRGGRVRPIVWTGVGLAGFQQLVGINVVFYYGAVLWQSVGFSENDALKINILSGALSILACLATILLIDRIGRKPLLLVGSAGMAVALAVVAACFSTGALEGGALRLSDGAGTTALVAANLYVILFNLSWGPVMWVMLGEMFPNRIRGSGLAVAGLAQWIANFAVSVSFPALAAGAGLPTTYALYAAAALVSFFFVNSAVRETRGRELEDMEG